MVRKIFSFFLVSSILVSCGNAGKKEASVNKSAAGPADKVEFTALVENPDNFIGKTISVDGKVVHVCTETGKKMFIVGKDPNVRLYVAAGENISKFPMELLGSEITVEGVITRVGGNKDKMGETGGEGTNKHEEGMKKMNGDNCETETALAEQPSLSNIIMEYKTHKVK
jgi:hypothetical protein